MAQTRRTLLWLLTLSIITAQPQSADTAVEIRKDIPFAEVDGKTLQLDLYRPQKVERPPLIVWVHGGAWRAGSKSGMPLKALVEDGYAIASVDYRLSTVAPFPAQIHDIKAAIRFLRGHTTELLLDASRIAIAGDSAGGHLAALVGVSNGQPDLEGAVGTNRDQSSSVQAVVSFYGASNLKTILAQSTPHGLDVRVPALQLLLGGQPNEKPELAALASPVTHVDASDPPLLLFHGDQDNQMPINQAHELVAAYQRLGLSVQLEVLDGVGHGGKQFYDSDRMKILQRFLDGILKKRS